MMMSVLWRWYMTFDEEMSPFTILCTFWWCDVAFGGSCTLLEHDAPLLWLPTPTRVILGETFWCTSMYYYSLRLFEGLALTYLTSIMYHLYFLGLWGVIALGLPHIKRLVLPHGKIITLPRGESLLYLFSLLFSLRALVHTSWRIVLWMLFLSFL